MRGGVPWGSEPYAGDSDTVGDDGLCGGATLGRGIICNVSGGRAGGDELITDGCKE